MVHRALARIAPAVVALATFSCGDDAQPSDFTDAELTAATLPASPTNAYAERGDAAELGEQLFLDKAMSADGSTACVSCHAPNAGFSDPKARSVGVFGQLGDRHAMPVTAAAFHPFLFWDGRADSAWSQAIGPLENPKEMGSTRVEVARRVAAAYAPAYEAVFGPLPDLAAAPERGMPGDPSWDLMPEALRDDVQRVFANTGKAIEAYERTLLCADTRFDRWVRGDGQLTSAEIAGAGTFRRQSCGRCHAGPSFSDGAFHDIGVPSLDRGRALGAPIVLADAFNGAGAYSDDAAAGRARLDAIALETSQEGAFRTASLRGVGQRTFFGHASHERELRDFILDIYRRGGRGRGRGATVGALDPILDDVDVDGDEVDDLVAFLHTLDCPRP